MKKTLAVLLLVFCLTGCGKLKALSVTKGTYVEPTPLTGVSPTLISIEDQLADSIEYMKKSTFSVYNCQTKDVDGVPTLKRVSSGSGVIYKKYYNDTAKSYTYYLLTNEHVVKDGESFEIYNGESTTKASLVGISAKHDIAILRFTTVVDYQTVKIADFADLRVGQFAIAIGTPLSSNYYNTTTFGIVSNITDDLIQHCALINAGNSGGPLFNIYGNVIGINVSKLSNNSDESTSIDGIGFAVSAKAVLESIAEIEAKDDGYVLTPVLGITVNNVSSIRTITAMTLTEALAQGFTEAEYNLQVEIASNLKTDIANGVMVIEIDLNGCANGHLQKYDVITKIGESDITESADLSLCLSQLTVGTTVTFKVLRGIEYIDIDILL